MSDASGVFDASALLCLLFQEPGAEGAAAALPGARMSSVNFSEVIAKLIDRGADLDTVLERLRPLHLDVVAFDRRLAETAGALRQQTRSLGLSIGDRACLALASDLRLPAITTDRLWVKVDVGVEVRLLR